MTRLKNFLNHPLMILTNDLFALFFVICVAIGVGLAFVAVVTGAPCPECIAIFAKPQNVIVPWFNSLF